MYVINYTSVVTQKCVHVLIQLPAFTNHCNNALSVAIDASTSLTFCSFSFASCLAVAALAVRVALAVALALAFDFAFDVAACTDCARALSEGMTAPKSVACTFCFFFGGCPEETEALSVAAEADDTNDVNDDNDVDEVDDDEEEEVDEEENDDDEADNTRFRHSSYSFLSFSLDFECFACTLVASNKKRFCLTPRAACFCPRPIVSKHIAVIEFKTS